MGSCSKISWPFFRAWSTKFWRLLPYGLIAKVTAAGRTSMASRVCAAPMPASLRMMAIRGRLSLISNLTANSCSGVFGSSAVVSSAKAVFCNSGLTTCGNCSLGVLPGRISAGTASVSTEALIFDSSANVDCSFTDAISSGVLLGRSGTAVSSGIGVNGVVSSFCIDLSAGGPTFGGLSGVFGSS